jgi:hypothetical protein
MSFLKEYIKMKTVMNYNKELYDNLRSNITTDEEVKNSTKDNKMNNKMDKKMDTNNFTADFGTAIRWLKEGKKVARKGWNGKNMWLVYMPPFRVEEPNERTQAHGIKEAFDCGGYIVMWTAQGVWQPGWLASQPDMLSDDWGIVE